MAFKRVGNITKGLPDHELDTALFQEDEERDLHRRADDARETVLAKVRERDFSTALQAIVSLKPAVDRFFDNVLVMDKSHPELQRNRIALLQWIRRTFHEIADFSRLQVEKS